VLTNVHPTKPLEIQRLALNSFAYSTYKNNVKVLLS
jgi:hypothetical protein